MDSLATAPAPAVPPAAVAMPVPLPAGEPGVEPAADPAAAPVPLTPEQLEALAQAEAQAQADREAAEREAQLQLLLQRMQKHADFPSLRESIRSIQTVARSEKAHLRALTDEVLGDVALSNKLLRMINTAFYSSVGGGNISSLQRAVALMGFQPVGMLATSLTLFDRLPKGPDGERVRKEFSRALMAAMLANQFCPVRRLEESAYIAAMFQNLGTMLAWMHFPPEAAEVEALVAQSETRDHEALQAASRQVLGMGYDDLAIEVARQWGWPESLQANLRRLEPVDPERPATQEEYLRVVCTAANRLAVELEQAEGAGEEALEALLAGFQARYGMAISLAEDDLPGMVVRARAQWDDLALVLGMAKKKPPPARPAAGRPGAKTAAAPAAQRPGAPAGSTRPATPPSAGAAAAPSEAAATRRPAAAPAPRRDPAVAASLSAAVGVLSTQAMSDTPLTEVLQLVMNRLQEALRLQRVVVCLRDASDGQLVGRLGVGDRAMKLAPLFRIPMQPPGDLFGLLCAKEADTLISDALDPVIAQRLPGWYRQHVQAASFVLLPLAMSGKPIGLIYGDHARPNTLQIDDNELSLLKALRNQLIMAMRLRGVSG